MSYCVNCGVKLEDSEAKCPLCGVEVVNPASPPPEKRPYPYPRRIEAIDNRVDRKIFTYVALIAALIPCGITIFYDAMGTDGGLSWSLYVAGALALALICVLLPVRYRGLTGTHCVAIDSIAAALYVLLIERLSGGGWFVPLGLPLCAVAGAALTLCVWLCSRNTGVLTRLAIILFIVGALAFAVEAIIDLFLRGAMRPGWSVYVLVPCALLGAIALLLRRRLDIKDEIRRRFYF